MTKGSYEIRQAFSSGELGHKPQSPQGLLLLVRLGTELPLAPVVPEPEHSSEDIHDLGVATSVQQAKGEKLTHP